MKKIFIGWFVLGCLLLIVGGLAIWFKGKPELLSPLASWRKIDYSPYSFENLQKRVYFETQINLEKVLAEEKDFTAYLFSFSADGRRITGLANLPKKEGPPAGGLPVAILLRGWVDEEIYQTGIGTQKMASFLAENGFLTLAPDFLGYGGSDPAFADTLLTRFFRPVTVITLLRSVKNLPQADSDRVVLWGHSNGGQIALSVLEITQEPIPTSLWAPVGAAFPESVLYFADDMEDRGKQLRETIARFETEYQAEDFSVDSFLAWVGAPLIVHQGLADEAIPFEWTDRLVESLRDLGKQVAYFRYPQENHNFNLGSAPQARERDLKFFQEKLGI